MKKSYYFLKGEQVGSVHQNCFK